MAYGIKYWFEYKDRKLSDTWKIELLLDSYASTEYEIDAAGPDPEVIRDRGGDAHDKSRRVIRGTEVEFTFLVTQVDNHKYDEIATSSYKDWILKRYKNGTLIFQGYVKPEHITRGYIENVGYYIKISATCGLGDLKSIEFLNSSGDLYSDRVSGLTILKRCIQAGALPELDFKIQLNTYESSLMTSSECVLDKVTYDCRRFFTNQDGRVKPWKCHEVIEYILKFYHVSFQQVDGYWHVWNAREYNSYVYEFDFATLTQQSRTASNLLLETTLANGYEFLSKGTKSWVRPLRRLEVKFENKNLGDDESNNGDFQTGTTTGWTNDNWDTWTIDANGTDYFLVTVNNTTGTTIRSIHADSFNIATFEAGDKIKITWKVRLESILFSGSPPPGQGYPQVYVGLQKTAGPLYTGTKRTILEADAWVEFIDYFDITSTGDYTIYFYVEPQETVTFMRYYWNDISFNQQRQADEITFDRVYIFDNAGEAFDEHEEVVKFGDSLQSSDIGALKIGGTLTESWNRYDKTDGLPILTIYGLESLSDFQSFGGAFDVTIKDDNDTIRPFNAVTLKGVGSEPDRTCEIIAYQRSQRKRTVELTLREIKTADASYTVAEQILTTVDGEKSGSSEISINVPTFWQQGDEGIYTSNVVAVGMVPTGTYQLEVNGDGYFDGDLEVTGTITQGGTAVSLAGHTHALNDLSDVTITTPSTDQVLKYNGSAWVNAALAGGGGGTVTEVTVGTGLDVANGTTTPDVTLSLDELSEKTGALVGTDRLVGLTGTTHFAETISGIPLSIFSNDSGWTDNTGTVTSVGTGTGLSGGAITTTGTISLSLNSLSEKTGNLVGTDRLIGVSGTTHFAETISQIPLSIFSNDSGWTANAGTVTEVTVGTALDVANGTTTPNITLDLSELSEKTGAVVGTDRMVIVSGTAQYAETISGIPLSIFNNDLGAGGTPAGSDGQVQYNNGGSFGGAAFYYDDTNGHLGFGTSSFSSWDTTYLAMEGPTSFIMFGETALSLNLGANSYWDGSTWRYKANGGSANVNITNNGIILRVVATGTLGDPLTYTAALTIDTAGVIDIGVQPAAGDSADEILLRDATSGEVTKLGIGTNLSVSGGNLNASGGSGTVTEVTVGTALDVANGTTTPNITLDLSELSEKTGALVGTDRIVVVSGTSQYAETISQIPLSIFNNDLGAGGSPGGSGTELQYRSGASTFGGAEIYYDATNGNISFGTSTFESWGSNHRVIQSYGGALMFSEYTANSDVNLVQNAYFNGTNYIYRTTDEASNYNLSNGIARIRVAGSGTAGTTITWINAFVVDATGALTIGVAPAAGDSSDEILLRDATSGAVTKLGIGTNLSVSGGNLNAASGTSYWTQTGSNIYYNTGFVGIGDDITGSSQFGVYPLVINEITTGELIAIKIQNEGLVNNNAVALAFQIGDAVGVSMGKISVKQIGVNDYETTFYNYYTTLNEVMSFYRDDVYITNHLLLNNSKYIYFGTTLSTDFILGFNGTNGVLNMRAEGDLLLQDDGSTKFTFDLAGTGSGTLTCTDVTSTSDIRKKHNIERLGPEWVNTITRIGQLASTFNWNSDFSTNEKIQHGFIAQELMEISGDFIHQDGEGFYNINYPKMIAPTMFVVSRNRMDIDDLRAENIQLKKEINVLKSMLI